MRLLERRVPRQPECRDGQDHLGQDEKSTAVEGVGKSASDQGEAQERYELSKTQKAHCEGGPGLGEYLKRNGHDREPTSDLDEPQPAKKLAIAVNPTEGCDIDNGHPSPASQTIAQTVTPPQPRPRHRTQDPWRRLIGDSPPRDKAALVAGDTDDAMSLGESLVVPTSLRGVKDAGGDVPSPDVLQPHPVHLLEPNPQLRPILT